MSLNFPIGSDLALRNQYKLLDLNSLRMGKIMELIDMLSHDGCNRYVQAMPERESIFFTNIAMGGLQFRERLKADADFSLQTYPIATTNSTITVRTDVMQKRAADESDNYQHVFSTNMLIAARSRSTNLSHSIPAIDLQFSDNADQASNRYDLAI